MMFVLLILLCKTFLHLGYCVSTCERGFYRVGDMTECHSWLTCKEIRNMDMGPLIGYGAVKQVYQSFWGNEMITYNVINNLDYINDFRDGLEMLKDLGPSQFIVQLVGFCFEANVFLTEYHPLGNSLNALRFLHERLDFDLKKKFLFCISYVKILTFLHDSPKGKRVMCDSSTLNKTLEQYLVTSSLSLILNDVDALPEVGKDGIVCGHKELSGSFIAPEQKWPYPLEDFQEEEMVPYDEKSDIWKISAVCNYFVGDNEIAKAFRYHLYPIHQKCRHKHPEKRPTAAQVLAFYEMVFEHYFIEKENLSKEEL